MKFTKDDLKAYIKIAFSIKDKQLLHYASSLSFHTMLSIIPVLLISFSIFTQMPSFSVYYGKIKEFIFSSLLPSNQEMITEHIETFLQNSSALGVLGLGAIIFTSIMFFMDYEYVINKIMKSEGRNFWSSLSVYWTLITLAPIGLGLSFYLSNMLQNLLNSNSYTNWINFLSIFPYLIIWAIFCITYLISVSRPIAIRNALFSSFIASLIWYFGKNIFVFYAVNNKTYLSIYGSFSVVLLFFLWVYVSWIIFLYGVKLCSFLEQRDKAKEIGKNEQEG
ncbi:MULTISPECIES: YihY family inner membrane protein [unclassified Campylobacter]|uniref:YihY family inner membrane protein n=1 Tax=unclassified Campylobacter TaxID=2593542 RepID=UPI001451AF99|nr:MULTISPECIES: YihY family inner membrane protein [unclassified Campylobacter]QCD52330.1 virulence factor, BrkB family protein [Campylobacter sp. RM16192]